MNKSCAICKRGTEEYLQDATSLVEDCAGEKISIKNKILYLCSECVETTERSLRWVKKCRQILKVVLSDFVHVKIEEFSPDTFEIPIKNEESSEDLKKEELEEEKQDTNALTCTVCGFNASKKSKLNAHMKTHSKKERPFKCEHCDKSFALRGTLFDHARRLHNKGDELKSVTCDVCGKCFFRLVDLRVHSRVHTKEKPYSCSICLKRFTQIGTLINHKMIHTGERRFSCETCGKRFITSMAYQRHLKVHSDEREFECQICNKQFKSKYAMQTHVKAQHEGDRKLKNAICETCGKTCYSSHVLKQHMIAKHSHPSGKCDVCNKVFINLTKHKRLHTRETPYQCEICNESFSFKKGYNIHMKKHGSVEMKCTTEGCSETFYSQSQLDYHVLKHHSGTVPYECSECRRGFYRLSDIQRHYKHSNCSKEQIK